VTAWHGAAAVVLRAGDYDAVVVPELSMLVASLRWRGREHVALPGGLREYRAGHTTGIPLLHPWANRLSRRSSAVDRKAVAVRVERNPAQAHPRGSARVDRRGVPTGRRVDVGGVRAPLGSDTSYDDAYALDRLRTFVLADGTAALRVSFGAGYPFAQIYAPPRAGFCAIEPMTAPTNALVTGDHPTVRPGSAFRTSFRASVVDLHR